VEHSFAPQFGQMNGVGFNWFFFLKDSRLFSEILRLYLLQLMHFIFYLTLSSAAGCKLVFCGKLLRSKTTKRQLTNCRAHEVCGAGAAC
jgi:hypothetical protein